MPSTNQNKNKNRNGKRGKNKKPRAKPITSNKRAGVIMSIPRIKKNMKDGRYAPRMTSDAAGLVYLRIYNHYILGFIIT